jgi:ribosome-associated heat shock protein Hsp15
MTAASSRDDESAARTVRIDKWLWAARFYKTRGLAGEAIKGGKVSVNGARSKASRELRPGDSVTLRQGQEQKTVIVRALSDQRGPASSAQQLYEETAESVTRREQEKSLRQLAAAQRPRGEGRPTKRDRRQLERLQRG